MKIDLPLQRVLAVAAPIEQMRGNITGDPYFTDGLRIVLWVSTTQVAIDEIEPLQWEIPQPQDRGVRIAVPGVRIAL